MGADIGCGATLAGSAAGTLGEVIDFDIGMMAEVEVIADDHMDLTERWREKIAGLKDAGRITFTIVYVGTTGAGADVIHSNLGVSQTWTVTFKDTFTWACDGFIQSHSTPIPHAGRVEQSVTIELSGKPTPTPV